MQRRINISEPTLGEQEYEALKAPISTGWLTQGPKVAAFEQAFAAHHQVPHAIATTSCTTALHLILSALGIGPGDEVIVPAFTWIATANVVLYCGATPVFADVDPRTFNLDPASVADKLSARTRAVIVVHLFGQCADMDALRQVIPADIPLVEDAACAVGATYKGRYAGSLGVAAAFSFHPRKIITTGEGGMVTTADAALAEAMTKLRNHGAEISEEQRHHGPKPYLLPDFNMLGFNYRMTDLQGAVGYQQMQRLPALLQERQHWAQFYCQHLADIPWLTLPEVSAHIQHSWQAFVVNVDPTLAPMSRNAMMEALQEKGVSTRPGTHALHMQHYYAEKYQLRPEDYPGAQFCHEQSIAIPLHNKMSAEDYQYVVAQLRALDVGHQTGSAA